MQLRSLKKRLKVGGERGFTPLWYLANLGYGLSSRLETIHQSVQVGDNVVFFLRRQT